MNRTTNPIPARPGPRLALLAVLGAAALAGCRGERSDAPPRELLPDMDNQQKFRPQSKADFFPDGRAMRPAVDGAVPFGYSTDPGEKGRADFLRLDAEFVTGLGADGKPLAYMPPAALDHFGAAEKGREAAFAAMALRGQERFNIYCTACHGYAGEGATPMTGENPSGRGGMAGRRWASPVPSYHDPKYTDRSLDTGTDGHLFAVIREGLYDIDPTTHEKKYRMPAYGHAVNPADAWAIVAYLRSLQASWTTNLASLTPDQRQQIERSQRPAAPAPATPPAAPAPGAAPAGGTAPTTPAPSTPAAPAATPAKEGH